MMGGGSTALFVLFFSSSLFDLMGRWQWHSPSHKASLTYTHISQTVTTSNLTQQIHPSSPTQTDPGNGINTAQNSNIKQQHRRSAVVTPPIAKTILSLLAMQTVALLTPESAPFQTASTDSGRAEITLALTRYSISTPPFILLFYCCLILYLYRHLADAIVTPVPSSMEIDVGGTRHGTACYALILCTRYSLVSRAGMSQGMCVGS